MTTLKEILTEKLQNPNLIDMEMLESVQ